MRGQNQSSGVVVSLIAGLDRANGPLMGQQLIAIQNGSGIRLRSSSGPAHAGTARIIVLRGWSLLAADKGGTSDPYVVVQAAGGKKEKTSVMKGTVNPVWDETLELSVPDYASPVYLEVWDHDKIGTNDSLGTGEILLGQCEPGVPTLLTVAIDTQGTVEVEVTWLPAERQQHGYAPAVTVDTSPMSVRRGLPSSLTQSQSAVELSPASRNSQLGPTDYRVSCDVLPGFH